VELFTQVPQDLSALDDEALAALRDEQQARIREVYAGRRDPEVVGEATQQEVTEALAAAVEGLELVKEAIKARAEEEEKYEAETAELAAKAGVDLSANDSTDAGDGSDDDDDDADDDESTAKGEVVSETKETEKTEETKVTASAKRKPLPAARKHKPKPAEHDTNGLRLTTMAAGAGAPYDGGTLLDRRSLSEVMTEMVKKNRVKPGQRTIVASATFDYPPDRILDPRDAARNMEKIQDVIPSSLVAAGGLCAPLTPIYDLPGVETAVRPVRDGLPSFQAVRGGVTVGATPGMGEYDDAVGVVTAANNEAGGTFATKSCRVITCPEFTSVEVDSIYHCIEADNLASRAYPELMARIDELVRAEQARLADGRLLTLMSAGSTDVTGPTVATGALYTFLGDVYKAAAAMRSRNRMPEAATLRAFFPVWLIDLLSLDITRGQFDRFGARSRIETILEQAGIAATFYLDGSSTATTGQVFGAQTAGALLDFPDTVEWFLFPEGTWLHLDSGTLELGIVRDSVLNSTNDFQIFGETWENIVKVGVESLVITSDVCPTGEVAATSDTVETC
jgi:hypothetical protein